VGGKLEANEWCYLGTENHVNGVGVLEANNGDDDVVDNQLA